MKRMNKAWGMLALALTFVLVLTACPTGGSDGGGTQTPQLTTYTSFDADGNKYELVITESSNRARYTPQQGDSYTLTITKADGTVLTSKGTVQSAVLDASGGITLILAKGNNVFIVQGEAGGGAIETIIGSIPVDNGQPQDPPTTLTPPDAEPDTWSDVTSLSQLVGSWKGKSVKIVNVKDQVGGGWDQNMENNIGSDMKFTQIHDITLTLTNSGAALNRDLEIVQTLVFSGSKLTTTGWPAIKALASNMAGDAKVTFDDSAHTVKWTMWDDPQKNLDLQAFKDRGYKINRTETKIKMSEDDGSEEIYIKQQ